MVATVKDEMSAEFEAWMSGEEGKALNIGDGGTKLTKEQRLDYARLTFAFKDNVIIAVHQVSSKACFAGYHFWMG